jgi:hypothetical protein
MIPRRGVGPLVALVMALASCGKADPPARTIAPKAAPARPQQKPSALVLPPSGSTPHAEWLESAAANGGDHRLEERGRSFELPKPDAFGMKAAIAKNYAVHADLGVVGPIAFPSGHTYVGLDGDDAVWVGTPSGFLRAADVRAARAGAFEKALPVAANSTLTAFTATKGLVAATDGTALFVTRNGAKRFEKKVYPAIRTIRDIAARADGSLVIVGHAANGSLGIWLTKWGDNPTRTLEDSSFEEGEPRLETHGAVLHVAGCPPVALAADGKRWFITEDDLKRDELAGAWLDPLVTSEYPRTFEPKHRTLVEPGAPVNGSATKTTYACAGGGGAGYGLMRRSGKVLPDCSFAECLVGTTGPEPVQTATRAAFYSDGSCEEGTPDACRTWKRAPQVWHSRIEAPLALPKGCMPEQLLTAGGIGVLLCKGEKKLALHMLDKAGVFHPEGEVAMSYVRDIRIAEDGTIMLEPPCSRAPCSPVAVRMPRPLGDASAWRIVSPSPGAPPPLTHRVLRGGNVLVVTGAGSKMSLWIDRPAQPPLALVEDLELPAAVLDVIVRSDRVLLSTIQRSSWVLTDQGLATP